MATHNTFATQRLLRAAPQPVVKFKQPRLGNSTFSQAPIFLICLFIQLSFVPRAAFGDSVESDGASLLAPILTVARHNNLRDVKFVETILKTRFRKTSFNREGSGVSFASVISLTPTKRSPLLPHSSFTYQLFFHDSKNLLPYENANLVGTFTVHPQTSRICLDSSTIVATLGKSGQIGFGADASRSIIYPIKSESGNKVSLGFTFQDNYPCAISITIVQTTY